MITLHRLLGSAGLLAIATACGTPKDARQMSGGSAGPKVAVQVVDVRANIGIGPIEVPATIESSRRAVVRSRLAASVASFTHREGDRVSAGELLVQLDGEALAAAFGAAQTADASATRDLARAEALLAKGAATRNEVENASTAAARARSALISTREAVSYERIHAPFAGRIVRKIAAAGDSVSPGAPLLEIEGDGGLEAVASVDASIHERLRPGQQLDIRIDGVTDPVHAVIRTLARSADPSTHRFTVRADVRGSASIRTGLFARIGVPAQGTERRLLVPAAAVLRRGGLTGVYVIRDGHAWLRWIAPGDSSGDSIEVRAGLDDKERVALDPSFLRDGASITEVR